jgi:hypothetical protein
MKKFTVISALILTLGAVLYSVGFPEPKKQITTVKTPQTESVFGQKTISNDKKSLPQTTKNHPNEKAQAHKPVSNELTSTLNIPEKETAPSPFDVLPIADPNEGDIETPTLATIGDDSAFYAEEVDVDWAYEAENEMWLEFDSAGLESRSVESLECRSASCKVNVVHENVEDQAVFIKQLVARADQYQGAIYPYQDPTGRVVTRLYRYR